MLIFSVSAGGDRRIGLVCLVIGSDSASFFLKQPPHIALRAFALDRSPALTVIDLRLSFVWWRGYNLRLLPFDQTLQLCRPEKF